MKAQKLKPVEVPWRIAVSTPCLELLYKESDVENDVRLSAMVQILVDTNIGEFINSFVEIVFHRCEYFILKPGYTERSVFDPSLYYVTIGDDLDSQFITPDLYRKVMIEKWINTGLCPDPGMYEVVGSREIQNLGFPFEEHRHYIMKGLESFIGIIAKDWTWQYSENGELR